MENDENELLKKTNEMDRKQTINEKQKIKPKTPISRPGSCLQLLELDQGITVVNFDKNTPI